MSEVVYTIEKAGNELTFTRDEKIVKVSCATPEECGYKPWILTNKGEEPEQIGYTKDEGNFICFYDNDLKLIKRKVR